MARSEGETLAGSWPGAGGAAPAQSSFGQPSSKNPRYLVSPTMIVQLVAAANEATWNENASGSRTLRGAGRGTRTHPASQVPQAHSAHSGAFGPSRPTTPPSSIPARPS